MYAYLFNFLFPYGCCQVPTSMRIQQSNHKFKPKNKKLMIAKIMLNHCKIYKKLFSTFFILKSDTSVVGPSTTSQLFASTQGYHQCSQHSNTDAAFLPHIPVSCFRPNFFKRLCTNSIERITGHLRVELDKYMQFFIMKFLNI